MTLVEKYDPIAWERQIKDWLHEKVQKFVQTGRPKVSNAEEAQAAQTFVDSKVTPEKGLKNEEARKKKET